MDFPQQVEIETERQIRMQTTHQVHFGCTLPLRFNCPLRHLINGKGIGIRCICNAIKGAEPAAIDTDVRGIDMAVYVEIHIPAVKTLIGHGSKFANGRQIVGSVQKKGVGFAQPFSGVHFFSDCGKGRHGHSIRQEQLQFKCEIYDKRGA